MQTICQNCGKKYSDSDLQQLTEIKRSKIQNIIKKKEDDDRKEFVNQPSIYKCIRCGYTLRAFNNERNNKEFRKFDGYQDSNEGRSFS